MSWKERSEPGGGSLDYEFPRLYVEGEESREYSIVDKARRVYLIESSRPTVPTKAYGLVPYESGWNLAVDPVRATITRGILVVVPWSNWKGLLLEEGTRVKILEVRGVQPVLVAREGDNIREGEVIAYVLTGKGETRTVRSTTSGLIAYIAWSRVEEERYSIIVASPEEVLELRPAGRAPQARA